MEEFVDRSVELDVLERAWRERPVFVVVYGRRRVGKTRLVREFLRSRRGVYFFSQLTSYEDNLQRLAQAIAEALGAWELGSARFGSLDKLLSMATRICDDMVLVLDEFTYWVRVSPRVLSELQYFVDEVLPKTKAMLIVIGSLYTVMIHDILGGSSPLYGRSRYRIHVRELDPSYIREFLPRYTPENRVRIYAILGSIPYYLRLVDDRKSLKDNIYDLLIAPHAPLRNEKDFMLREEFRDPHTYNAILSAIARGYNTPSKIADLLGLDRGYVAKCLHVLEEIGYVEKELPLFARRARRYKLRDPILRTWYHLVEPVLPLIELELYDKAVEYIMEKIDAYTASVYEELVSRIIARKYVALGYRLFGKLVRGNEEIDLALINPETREAIVVEVKWSNLDYIEARREINKLSRKAYRLLPDYTIKKTLLVIRRLVRGYKDENILTVEDLNM